MPQNTRFLICVALLIVSTVLGGGGSPSPIPELIVELSALLALGAWRWAPESNEARKTFDRPLWIAAAIFAAVPIIQFIPLPPALWHALPGRDAEVAVLNLIGEGESWRPISVAPYRTLASALSLIPPITLLFFVSHLSLHERTKLLGVIALLGIVAALVGVLQVASGEAGWFTFYPYQIHGFASGFQANRNSGADVLLIGATALAGYTVSRREFATSQLAKLTAAALALLLILSVVLTGSRAGTALILPLLVSGAAILLRGTNLRKAAAGAAIVVVLLGVGLAALNNAQIDRTVARFSSQPETRPGLWKDTIYAIGENWPIGSGVGTFIPVMTGVERLEAVDETAPNRAHNDYLEFALETGLAGCLILLGFAVALIARAWRILRRTSSSRHRTQAIAALGMLSILGLHSMVDYPMRSIALAGLAAVAIGLLSRVATGRGDVCEVW